MDSFRPTAIKKKRRFGQNLFVYLLVIGAVGAAIFFYSEWQKARAANEGAAATAEVTDMVYKVKQLIILPAEETPVLLTIKDKNEINSNLEFFKSAENGDKVLLYKNARKAYLYRPSQHILVNVSSITIEEGKGQVAGTSTSN